MVYRIPASSRPERTTGDTRPASTTDGPPGGRLGGPHREGKINVLPARPHTLIHHERGSPRREPHKHLGSPPHLTHLDRLGPLLDGGNHQDAKGRRTYLSYHGLDRTPELCDRPRPYVPPHHNSPYLHLKQLLQGNMPTKIATIRSKK